MESKDYLKRLARLRVQLLVLLLVLVGVGGWGMNPEIDTLRYPGGAIIMSGSGNTIQNAVPEICPNGLVILRGIHFGTATWPNPNYKIEIESLSGPYAANATWSFWGDDSIRFTLPATVSPGLVYRLQIVSNNNNNRSQVVYFAVPGAPTAQYPVGPFCELQGAILPINQTGSAVFAIGSHSNFQSSPVINSATGEISNINLVSNATSASIAVSVSGPNSCGYAAQSINLVVNPSVPTSISYPSLVAGAVCKSTSNQNLSCQVVPFSSSGAFSISGAGISPSISTSLGHITVAPATSLGAYTIVYQPNGCYDPSATTVTVIGSPVLSYPSSTVCKGGPSMAPSPVEPQGSFSVISGQGNTYVNSATGEFNPASAPVGLYVIQWTNPNRPCSPSAIDSIMVIAPADPGFSYPTTPFCNSDPANPVPSIANVGGSFASLPLWGHLNTTTGEINVKSPNFQAFGLHVIEYTTAIANGNSTCTLTQRDTITLVEDRETLTYLDYQVCAGDPPLHPNGLGASANLGAFASYPTPGASILNTSTGVIDPSATNANTSFRVCWTQPGRMCRDSICTPQIIQATAAINPWFEYVHHNTFQNQTHTCQSALPLTANANATNGTFAIVSANSTSLGVNGEFGDGQTPPDTFRVRHVTGTICPDTHEVAVIVLPKDSIDFAYLNSNPNPDSTFCQSDKFASPIFFSAVPMNGLYIYMGQDTNFHVLPNGIIEFENAGAGTHQISYYSSTGQCPNTGYASIILFDSPESGFELASFSICEGQDSLLIIADDLQGGVWKWQRDNLTSSTLYPSSTGNIYTGSALPGRYKVTHEINLGTCQSTSEQFFTILDYNDTTHIVLDSTGVICAGDQVSFQIDGVKTGIFSISSVTLDGTPLSGITASLGQTLSDTQFVARYSGYGQCNEADSLTFQVRAKDATRLAFPDASACENDPLAPPSLWAPGQGVFSLSDTSYYRIDPATGSLLQTDPLVNETRISVTYRTDSICPNEATFALEFYPKPKNINLAVTQGDTSCFGTPLNLVASASGAQAFGFVLDGDTTQAISTNAFCDIDSVVVGLRELVVVAKSSRSCINAETFHHLVHPIPYYVEGIPADLTLIQNEQINLDIRTQPSSSITYWQADRANYEFVNPGDTGIASPERLLIDGRLVNAYSGAEILVYLQPQANGCYGDRDSVLISVQPVDVEVFIPGIITPNGDNLNDAWEIRPKSGFSARNFTMKVFTNQGSLVKRFVLNAEELTLWSADEVPDGIYRWMLFDGEGNFYRKGALTILRTPIKDR